MPATAPNLPRRFARALARTLLGLLWLALLALGALWAWRQPFMERARTLWELSRMPPPATLPVPVQSVAPRQVADTFGAPRGADRRHEGVDIFAPRGTPVTSTTRGVVVAINDRGLGGRQVWVLGPAGERHYYAHLDDWAPGLAEGDVVEAGAALGTVGNSGNARGTPPHLHYGVYGSDGALDPLPRMRAVR
ncbi:M23 family metallopeptidase [Pseudoxanthomonas kaohsiungensis]|jgi:murein DD-endopeptidase MepM/ murein hydrolase activator NlpD|uniref:M23 family metallopeptidase n=1 Tax=Pseudoxanthomonas kaohsiungensis TaxID=283923 RepID=A0ABW3LVS7_9GAMM|nr:M23 family metallopeptidase [Pseudoxanthomonas kaohsiungensis]KAF1700503.1 peptidase [Pseudoxanthomonas kaohsiungensis]